MNKTDSESPSCQLIILPVIEFNYEHSDWRSLDVDSESIVATAFQGVLNKLGMSSSKPLLNHNFVDEEKGEEFKEPNYGQKSIEISVMLSDDEKLRELKSNFFGIDSATNVLSFPANDLDFTAIRKEIIGSSHFYLGDIAFSLATIQKEAFEQGKEFKDHLMHLAVHSILHLFGYDHQYEVEADVMESLEIEVLGELGISNPYEER